MSDDQFPPNDPVNNNSEDSEQPLGSNGSGESDRAEKPGNAGELHPLVPILREDGNLYLPDGTKLQKHSIEDEMKGSYLTYAMSVIISRAIPDVRDGLKPSQRRILVAMNDIGLGPGSARVKCAKISGDTSGNYHPHGESVIYPTLVRMAQDWNMRHVLIDKQGNFGSIAGLPAAAMRYTEARLSALAAAMLDDIKLDTVDFVPTYDEQHLEPVVLPSKVPNLLVNGANGIAVGMATSIPPHNLAEICDATIAMIDDPEISPFELLRICPGPDFPTGGIVCGTTGIRRGYLTGRSNITIRARAKIEEVGKRHRIVVSEIPYQQARDNVEERIAKMVTDGKIAGISGIRNESDLEQPVRLILELKKDADPDVVLNQLYQYTPLQDTYSIILLALVDGKPRVLTFKEMLYEFLRHRTSVIRRRTQFLLSKAMQRQHTVEGLLIAHANIDEVIRVIRTSKTQQEAKERLMLIQCPAAMLQRALGDDGYQAFTINRKGAAENYSLTPVQADAILKMTLGQLVNLEQEKLGEEYRNLLSDIGIYRNILSDDNNILQMVRDDLVEIKKKFGDARRTEICETEVGEVDLDDLISEETMAVSISANGYIKRTPIDAFKAQRRGGKGLRGAKLDDEDPIRHLFVASTHAYLMFFTNKGKVYWHKVYNLPQLARDAKGRNLVNLLNLSEGELIADCRGVKDFDVPGHFLIMATKNGLVKKSALAAFRRPLKAGLIAIKLREGDELIDVDVCGPHDEIVLSTANGRAIRFRQSEVRCMGRNSSGVKGISLKGGDHVVGMTLADENDTLLTICANGYGKRTPFGPNAPIPENENADAVDDTNDESANDAETNDVETNDVDNASDAEISNDVETSSESESGDDEVNSTRSYRITRRGGGGVMDIKTSKRNGPVIAALRVAEDDEIMMITARGKLQRIAVAEMRVMGRNTQGVRVMNVDNDDVLVAVNRIPKDENAEQVGAPDDSMSDDRMSDDSMSDDSMSDDRMSDDSMSDDSADE